jgi:hypothetical protein
MIIFDEQKNGRDGARVIDVTREKLFERGANRHRLGLATLGRAS